MEETKASLESGGMGDISTVSRGSEVNFAFAFNDSDFSDRILRLEIDEDKDNIDSSKKLTPEKYNDWFSSIQSKDSKSSDGAKVTSLNICSLVLAVKSPFFHKMFKNGMRESQKKNEVCLKIKDSEEATLVDLIRFMYGETTLNATSFHDLVDLLITADKFEVNSCMIHCVDMLLKFPMSLEHALFLLELPSIVLVSEIVKPLKDSAKQFVAATYKDFIKSQEEAMQLPLSAIEVVLGSEGLQVESEDKICDFILKWARKSYPELEERREILTKRLTPLICFSNMSVLKLKEVLASADFDHEHLSKIVLESLFFKIERSHMHLTCESMEISTTQCCSAGRPYIPHCVVFFDLTKDKCAGLFPLTLDSPKILLGEKQIYLTARFREEKDGFGLFVMPVSENCTLDFEISVMKKSLMEFESRLKVNKHTLPVGGWGMQNLFGITRTKLLSDDSDYFINGVLRLKIELTLKNS